LDIRDDGAVGERARGDHVAAALEDNGNVVQGHVPFITDVSDEHDDLPPVWVARTTEKSIHSRRSL
jgi:hypothetical protein